MSERMHPEDKRDLLLAIRLACGCDPISARSSIEAMIAALHTTPPDPPAGKVSLAQLRSEMKIEFENHPMRTYLDSMEVVLTRHGIGEP